MRRSHASFHLLLIMFLQLFNLVTNPLTPQINPNESPKINQAVNGAANNFFIEDYSNTVYKRYASNINWDNASGELSLLKLDSFDQKDPDITATTNNHFILVWRDDREGNYHYYAQKMDAKAMYILPGPITAAEG
jgi:hypothetical protein